MTLFRSYFRVQIHRGRSLLINNIQKRILKLTRAQLLVPKLVVDADSSQFLSLMKVASGQNIALEGPPGSGKSQTIVNLIANAISQNKKVLFVAQKGTALEVVLSRMAALNLDSLVLPLMGAKRG